MNPMFSQQIVAGNVSPVVVDWVNRVQKNGGAKPSQNTIVAVNDFYHNIASTTILGKVKSLNCYVPDNVIAAITPLINTVGRDPWLNNNNQFVAADLTINGLKGNGSDQFNTSGMQFNKTTGSLWSIIAYQGYTDFDYTYEDLRIWLETGRMNKPFSRAVQPGVYTTTISESFGLLDTATFNWATNPGGTDANTKPMTFYAFGASNCIY